MTDASLVRVLQAQTAHPVDLVRYDTVAAGAAATREAFGRLAAGGRRHAIVDAMDDDHLLAIGAAAAELPLICGGSGIALGLPGNMRAAGLLADDTVADRLPPVGGGAVVLSGSCSEATRRQVAWMAARRPAWKLDPLALAADPEQAAKAVAWAGTQAEQPVLIYATAEPAEVRAAQDELGRERAGEVVEQAMGRIARALVQTGVRRLVVAGGETSGAVVQALGIRAIRIGPQIDPGVPWTASLDQDPVALALKSGNFGGEDFFLRAFELL